MERSWRAAAKRANVLLHRHELQPVVAQGVGRHAASPMLGDINRYLLPVLQDRPHYIRGRQRSIADVRNKLCTAVAAASARLHRRGILQWYLYHGGLGYPLMAGLEAKFLVPPFASTLIAATATFVAAWLSYRVVEQPAIRLGRTLERRVLNSALRVAAEHAAKR
jgi:hypothetical protein